MTPSMKRQGFLPGKIGPLVVGLALACACGQAAAALYVYQMPGGTRIVTDRPIKNKDYVLIRKSNAAVTMDDLVAQQRAESVWPDVGRYAGLIHNAAAAHRVEPALVKAVMHAESAFDPYAVSPRGAQGLMQLMPETARRYGVTDVFDPVQNIEGGVRFLRDLMRAFGQNRDWVLAAYNAGPQTVLRYNGVPPYDETLAYIRKVRLFREYYSGKNRNLVAGGAAVPGATSGAPRERPTQAPQPEPLLAQEAGAVVTPQELVVDAGRGIDAPQVGRAEEQVPQREEGGEVAAARAPLVTDPETVVDAVVARADQQTIAD